MEQLNSSILLTLVQSTRNRTKGRLSNQRGRVIGVLLACYRRQRDGVVLTEGVVVERGADVVIQLFAGVVIR